MSNFVFPGGDQQEDIPTLSARIEEKQKRVDSRKEWDNEREGNIKAVFVLQARLPE